MTSHLAPVELLYLVIGRTASKFGGSLQDLYKEDIEEIMKDTLPVFNEYAEKAWMYEDLQ